MLISVAELLGEGERDGGLADAARTGNCEKTPLRQLLRKVLDVVVASNQRRQELGKIVQGFRRGFYRHRRLRILNQRDRSNKAVAPPRHIDQIAIRVAVVSECAA